MVCALNKNVLTTVSYIRVVHCKRLLHDTSNIVKYSTVYKIEISQPCKNTFSNPPSYQSNYRAFFTGIQ